MVIFIYMEKRSFDVKSKTFNHVTIKLKDVLHLMPHLTYEYVKLHLRANKRGFILNG